MKKPLVIMVLCCFPAIAFTVPPRHGRVVVSKVRLSAVSPVISWDTAELGRPPGGAMNMIGNGKRLAAPATRQMDLRANRGDDETT